MDESELPEEAPESPRKAIGLRLAGQLASEVAARETRDKSAGAIVKRDLARYYRLLSEGLRGQMFGPSQAEALVLCLAPHRFQMSAQEFIWAQVEKVYREIANDPDDEYSGAWWFMPTDFDPSGLVERLRKLDTLQRVALLDNVECYWAAWEEEHREGASEWEYIDEDLLVTSRLTTRQALESRRVERERDQKERDAGQLVLKYHLSKFEDPSPEDEPDGP